MNRLGKYSLGIGDRFMQEGRFQLTAFAEAKRLGIDVTPVWNKSQREHITIGSEPASVRHEAEDAVGHLKWKYPYLVDADHITCDTVDRFLAHSDFFTIDVADQINGEVTEEEIFSFRRRNSSLVGDLQIDGIETPFHVSHTTLDNVARTYAKAIEEVERIYRKIKEYKGGEFYVVEVSVDESDHPQSPLELFFILKMLADRHVPVQTIAPKFTGRFNKGVDYEGVLSRFEKEFEEMIFVVKHAVTHFGLPADLKISIHTGSDKFSLYPIVNRLIKKHNVGLHVKTSGTTWLEEVIGLAEAGGEALDSVKKIYANALSRYEELTSPYQTVLNINAKDLPSAEEFLTWKGVKVVNSLSHDQNNPNYNPSLRQFFHTAYKVAAENTEEFISLLKEHREIVGRNVLKNILERHLRPLFR